MGFTIGDVIAAAGVGSPWDRAQDVATADPGAIGAMAAGFGEAAGHARTAMAAAQRADPVTATSYLVDRAPVHNAPAATAATRTALADGGEHPDVISRMLVGVAAELTGTRTGVQAAIGALDAELQAISAASARLAGAPGTDPAAAAAAERALFDQAVAAVRNHGGRINTLLDDYNGVLASRTGMLTGLGYTGLERPLTGPAAPPPPPGGTPVQNEEWWRSLTPEQQRDVLINNPQLVGNLDGLPAEVRDAANRARLESEGTRLDGEIATTQARLEAARQEPPIIVPRVGPQERPEVRELADQLARLQEQRSALGAVRDTVAGDNRQLLLLDISGHAAPRAAVAVGDIDTADHVAVFTPGLESTVSGDLGRYTQDVAGVVVTAEQQLLREGRDTERVAAVAWIGYDAPQLNTTFQADRSVALPFAAQHGGADLARFYDGINASRPGDDPHLTALGHSYGSSTTGYALQQTTSPVDDAVVFGSPGVSTDHVSDLPVPDGHVAVIEARRDPVADLGSFGSDPNHLDGVVNLSAREQNLPDGTRLQESTGHSAYLVPGTTSQHNIAATVAGLPENRIEGRNSGFGDFLRDEVPQL
jgi:Alpha/beta hydrolase